MLRLIVIVEYLEAVGMSQRQICALLGVSGSRWKDRTTVSVSAAKVDRVLIGLGVHPVEVYGFEDWCGPVVEEAPLAEVIELRAPTEGRIEGAA